MQKAGSKFQNRKVLWPKPDVSNFCLKYCSQALCITFDFAKSQKVKNPKKVHPHKLISYARSVPPAQKLIIK